MRCKECGEDVDELVSVKVDGRSRKVCDDCRQQLSDDEEVATAAESTMQSMMEYKGRR
ncbi:MAG: hypothetical protein ACO3JL_13280 [Myxococcota bacterium]